MRSLRRFPFAVRLLMALVVATAFPAYIYASEVVTASVTPGVSIVGTTSIGGSNLKFTGQYPAAYAATTFANGTGAQQVSVKWVDTRTYSATPTTLDLTSLSGATSTGSATFSAIKLIGIYNNDTTSGHNVTIGAAAATPFTGPLGGTGPTITLGPGEACVFFNLTAGGWACGTNKNLKVDPGANNVSVTIALAGN